MADEHYARPLGTPDTFRPLIVRPHPRLDPPGARCRVDGVEIRNPAVIRAEPPLSSPPEPEPMTAIRGGARGPGPGRPKATAPSATAGMMLKLLRQAPDGLSPKELHARLRQTGYGSVSRQAITYHLNKLCSLGLARGIRRPGSGAWGDRPRAKKIYLAITTTRK